MIKALPERVCPEAHVDFGPSAGSLGIWLYSGYEFYLSLHPIDMGKEKSPHLKPLMRCSSPNQKDTGGGWGVRISAET